MARAPLPIGTWGKIRTYVVHINDKGKADRHRAIAQYRDFDGRTRQVEAFGKTQTGAENALRKRLKDRSETGRRGELTAMHRLSDAVSLWIAKYEGLVADGRRSATSLDTYRRAIRLHILPAEPWARRAGGVLANELARAAPDQAHALLTRLPTGGFVVSLRAPLTRRQGADELCRRFPTGGGRPAAAGINQLPEEAYAEFVTAFMAVF